MSEFVTTSTDTSAGTRSDVQRTTNPTGQQVVQQADPDTGKMLTLPAPAPCPWWCTVEGHRTGLWDNVGRVGTNRWCRRTMGKAECALPTTDPTVGLIEVHIERFQNLDENGVVVVCDPAVATDAGWHWENQLSPEQAAGLIRVLGDAAGILTFTPPAVQGENCPVWCVATYEGHTDDHSGAGAHVSATGYDDGDPGRWAVLTSVCWPPEDSSPSVNLSVQKGKPNADWLGADLRPDEARQLALQLLYSAALAEIGQVPA